MQQSINVSILALSLTFVTPCITSASTPHAAAIGLTKDEAINIYGHPKSIAKSTSNELLRYTDFTLILENNHVTKVRSTIKSRTQERPKPKIQTSEPIDAIQRGSARSPAPLTSATYSTSFNSRNSIDGIPLTLIWSRVENSLRAFLVSRKTRYYSYELPTCSTANIVEKKGWPGRFKIIGNIHPSRSGSKGIAISFEAIVQIQNGAIIDIEIETI